MNARLLVAALLVAAAPAQAQVKQIAQGPVEAPYSLTAADGTGLRLVGVDARAVVDGPLAFTELHLTFENPEPRVIEGHFKVTMPDGAAISRFAMKINGAWMEGEVVEKQAARRAYEDALHRRQDPALLEQDSGNTFAARVFPIGARERKELIVSWSHQLTQAGEAYRLPLRGLPAIEKLTLTALTSAQGGGPSTSLGGSSSRYQVSKVEKTKFAPDEDWIVYGGDVPAGGDALRNGNLAVARFVVPGGNEQENIADTVVMFDTSASRAIDFQGRLEALGGLVRGLAEIGVTSVTVIAFDQFHETVYTGSPKDFGEKALARLNARGALGASSLQAALEALEGTKGANRRVIFLTDGQITAGLTDGEALRKRLSGLASVGIQRADAIVDTTARDPQLLDMLVTSDLPSPGKVIEGRGDLKAQLDRLGRKTLADVTVTVPGAEWVWPAKIRGLQGGDAVVAFADLPAGNDLTVQLGGGTALTVKPAAREAEKPLLERAWIAARIARLQDLQTKGDPDLREALKHQIIALSTRHRVLSPYTALVVLETEHDYRRFGIDRRALSDILVVGPTGVELQNRKDIAVAAIPPPPPPQPVARPRDERQKQFERPRNAPPPAAKAAPARSRGGDGDALGAMEAGGAPAGAAAPSAPPPAEPMDGADGFADMAEASAADDEAPPVVAAAPAPEPEPEMAARRADATSEADKRATSRRREAAAPRRPHPDPFPGRRPPPPVQRPVQQVAQPTGESEGRRELREIEKGRPSLTGELAEIDTLLSRGKVSQALSKAQAWRNRDAADLLALVALGRSLAMNGDGLNASRAFGSILDLYPSRADMRRMAGNWLARLGTPGLLLAADTYGKAAEQRPDHPSVYHQLAMSLVRAGRYEEALDTLLKGLTAQRVDNRFPGVDRILQEDAQLVAAAWAAAQPEARAKIEAKLQPFGLRIDDRATMRFVLTWETDANDVDFHIFDGKYNHAYYSRKVLATGGELYADVTTGYGPECFTIFDPAAFPYRLKAHYYRRGPMGYGAGMVQIIRHDGKGNLGFEDRPFVIMQDGAYVDLGTVDAKTAQPEKTVVAR